MIENNTDKKGLGQRMQDYMSSYRGKVVLNYAYSWGAAIVIAGTLFKLTHLPGANLMLWIGMGTEVLVFFISAFELPAKLVTPASAVEVPASGIAPVSVSRGPSQDVGASSVTPAMTQATEAYVAQLKEMTERLSRFAAQTESLAHDAEQMSALNRNLSGINAIYEMQLRSASAQIGTIDQVHEQTRKMAQQIEELNTIYARMIQAVRG